jgi:alkylation response protein AidB-like acyl-CoA dehydrogenase
MGRASLRLGIHMNSTDEEMVEEITDWIAAYLPDRWKKAALKGVGELRSVRTREEYEEWYPVFAESGLAVSTWPVEYLGLGLSVRQARIVDNVLAPFNLGRLNPLGLNSAAPALFAFGSERQKSRFLPPIVRNEEKWCQLLSEPGAGSDLASLSTRAVRDGDEWVLDGQKVWTTWAHFSDFAVCLARTDPKVPKRNGLTYFVVDLRMPGVTVRPLRHIGGIVDFNEVFLDEVRVPDEYRLGDVGQGWKVANAALSGERQMVSGSGSGGVDRIGGRSVESMITELGSVDRSREPVLRQRLMALYSEEKIREWTNRRVRAAVKVGGTPGPAASIGKVHQGVLNQRIQMLAVDLLGAGAQAWNNGNDYTSNMPLEVRGMLRSRANTIEGGTTEVNKTILGERVLGLPRDVDQWADSAWEEVPRS